jgi:hypothetical protein
MSGPVFTWVESILIKAVCSSDNLIFLVSKCGKKFVLNAELAKSSSEYFAGLLQAGMIESGKSVHSWSRITHEKIEKVQSRSKSFCCADDVLLIARR